MSVAIYHEKQFGLMCGQHCLNNLLQGPYFSPADLSEIASNLDAAERELMLSAGVDTEAAVQFLGQDSNNVDDSGNFSIQVLNSALQNSHGITLKQDPELVNKFLNSLDQGSESVTHGGFVCNLHGHWFVIRSVLGEFWNLNSLNQRPEKISKFFLSAYLSQLQVEGWSIFFVQGELPPLLQDYSAMGARENWFVLGVDDVTTSQTAPPGHQESDADSSKARFVPFQGSGNSLSHVGETPPQTSQHDQDDDLQRAIEMSLAASAPSPKTPVRDEPPKGAADIARIQFVLRDGRKLKRRFFLDEQGYVLFQFLEAHGQKCDRLSRSGGAEPVLREKDGEASLQSLNLGPSASLILC